VMVHTSIGTPPFHRSLRSVRLPGRIRKDRPEKRKQRDALHQDAVSVAEGDWDQRPERSMSGCVGLSAIIEVAVFLDFRHMRMANYWRQSYKGSQEWLDCEHRHLDLFDPKIWHGLSLQRLLWRYSPF
jgi:hypothetical protein